jgi:chloramphenicol 3-O-phosphotransferase
LETAEAPVFNVTGPAGAGKSTVARELCRRFPKAAHIEVDLLRWRMILSGYVRPEEAYGAEPDEALRQLALAARNACSLARNFAAEGFVAVIDDVLERREELDLYLDELAGLDPVYFVTLLPNAETLIARDAGRSPEDFMGSRSEELRRIIEANGETRGLRLDSSAWTVEETVDIILERQEQARVAPGGESAS